MKKLVYIVPHLSTGGLPQYTLKMIQEFIKDFDVYCIEYSDRTGGKYVVQRNQVVSLLGDNFYSLPENKKEIHEIISNVNPDVIHFQEIPQSFISSDDLNIIYSKNRKYTIVVTTHGSLTEPSNIVFGADKYVLVSEWSRKKFIEVFDESICDIWEYPITNVEYDKDLAKKELGFDSKYKHVLNVGLFTFGKNQGELINLAKKLKDKPIKFHFVGNQAENFRDYWGDLMENFSDNCIWHGERNDVENFYKASDAFYFTSNLELNPLVVKEALSYGLPTFIKNLDTYNNQYDGKVNYITNSQYENVTNLLRVLGIEESNPRIQAIHLLTNTTHEREIKSIGYISKLADYGIKYTQHINKPYDELPPKDFCKRPHLISDKPQYIANGFGALTGRHYGCFLAHVNAIKSISNNYDYTLIFEADANIETPIEEFIDIVNTACKAIEMDDVYYISFSNNPSHKKVYINEDFTETLDQTLTQAYLIPNKYKDWYLDKIEKVPWDGYDLWLNDVFKEYPEKRYTTHKIYSNQIEGLSLIDNVVKWENDSNRYDYIEIGTSDFETMVEYMGDDKLGLSIDPMQMYLNRLPEKSNNKKINVAISDTNYTTNVYYISLEDIETNNFPEWVKRCNSIDKPHPSINAFLKERNLEHILKCEPIECISFEELVNRYDIIDIDFLKVDTEGNDITILNNMLKTNVRPKKIYFEANSLYNDTEIVSMIKKLEESNYHLVHRDFNNVTMRLKDEMYKEIKKPILIISSGRRNNYLEIMLKHLFDKNPNLSSKLEKTWILDDRSSSEDRKFVDELMNKYFGDNYNTIHFNSIKPFDFVDKFNMISKLINYDDVVLFLEDDWECKANIRLEYHVNKLLSSDWTQIAFCDPLYAQKNEIKNINCEDLDYWYNPYPNMFRHPIRWNGDIYHWVGGSINNWTNNPSIVKGSVFHKFEFKKIKNFEAQFANELNGRQVFTNEELFRHFGEDSLINKL
jgi:GR25 family glycosyltransferase involved in LPS biosynthesis